MRLNFFANRRLIDSFEPRGSSVQPGVAADVAIKTILVATDFSEASERAFAYAISMAAQLRAEIVLLHVFEPIAPELKILESAFVDPSFREQASRELSEWRSKVPAAVSAQTVFREAKAAHKEILNAAAQFNVDLIVMGGHGRNSLGRFVSGSTAEHVLKHAPCAVLVAAPQS